MCPSYYIGELYMTDLYSVEENEVDVFDTLDMSTNGVINKVQKFETKQKRESIHFRFKESDFWDYSDSRAWRPCYGYHYFDTIISKYVNQPFACVIAKCRNHILYIKHKGFKDQVNRRIYELMNRPEDQSCYNYSTNFREEYYVDDNGILRDITTHPLYSVRPHKERVMYRNWKNPNRITTSSYKTILKGDDGIHKFVPHFEVPVMKIIRYNKVGKPYLTFNPEYLAYRDACVPLTKDQLNLYGLINTPK